MPGPLGGLHQHVHGPGHVVAAAAALCCGRYGIAKEEEEGGWAKQWVGVRRALHHGGRASQVIPPLLAVVGKVIVRVEDTRQLGRRGKSLSGQGCEARVP